MRRAWDWTCKQGAGRARCLAAAIGVAVLLLPQVIDRPAQAQEMEVSTEVGEIAAADLRIGEGSVRITLDEAITIALRRNLGLQVERYNLSESEFVLTQNRGIYDLNASAEIAAFDETTPSASNLAGADVQKQEGQDWNFGLDQLFPSGGTLSWDWTNRRFDTNSLFATLNPSYTVNFDVTYNQPLMRNNGRLATDRNIRIAAVNVDISRENFELTVTATVREVERAYWDLVEALDQLEVAVESLDLARQLHEQNRIRVEVGTLAPLELVQSEAGVATREEQLIRARALVGDRGDVLRQILNLEQGDLWELPLVPETSPEIDPVEIDLQTALKIATEERPELRGKRLSLRNLETNVAFFRNQRLPRLDLGVTYGFNGLGGDITERDFFTGEILFQAPGDYGDALDQITGGDFDGWSLGLVLAYPLQNRMARAQSAVAEVALERGQTELRELELQVHTEVRRLIRAVQTAAQAIESAGVSQRLEERNLDAERKRYENGMSTSFQVLQIQEDLTEARSRLVTAIATYRRTLALYYAAIGRLIDESGIEIVSGGASAAG